MKPKITTENIASLDEYGNRIGLNPAEVTGFYRTRRTIVQSILIVFFLVLPWTTIGGYQTLLIDIPAREFYFFGFFFRAHNLPFMFFLFLGGIITLGFVTVVWGRVWCGWACPQTVFIDGVFRRIEYFIEGNYLARRKQAIEPLTIKAFGRKTIKWIIYYFASVIISHSALAYFVGAHLFVQIIQDGPQSHLSLFLFAQALTAVLLFDFGWFREQFCTIMCPYGRFQGLLLNENSLAVVYDEKRDDCVKCNRCVNACPIGIDIRNGLQMECIACTACIDACDEIMEKVNKPKRLIKYDTLNSKPISIFRPRSLIFIAGILICAFGFIYGLATFQHSEAFILRSATAPFTLQTENGIDYVTNQFRFHVTNQSHDLKKYKIQVIDNSQAKITSQLNELSLKAKASYDWHFFITLPRSEMVKPVSLKLQITDAEHPEEFTKIFTTQFVGPSSGN